MRMAELTRIDNDGTKTRMAFPPGNIVLRESSDKSGCWVYVIGMPPVLNERQVRVSETYTVALKEVNSAFYEESNGKS